MVTENDLREIENGLIDIIGEGISASALAEQIERFKTGFAPTKLERACTLNDGIYRIKPEEKEELLDCFEEAADEGRFTKFVPASGAATRMFKHLLAKLNDEELSDKDADMVQDFMDLLPVLPFYSDLQKVMMEDNANLEDAYANQDYAQILEYLLTEKGLNYAAMPKGLIPFHNYEGGYRTPFEEHIAEAAAHIKDRRGKAKLHFTVSPIHEQTIRDHVAKAVENYPDCRFDINFSQQCRKSDTVAVDMDNEVFRTDDGKILFRPAGHGALLDNLHKLRGDLVYLKNIDNVVPDSMKGDTLEYKKIIGGLLVKLQDQIFECLNMLENHNCSEFEVAAVAIFAVSHLSMQLPDNFGQMSLEDKITMLRVRLSKPVRVCGMVKNEGEPGGGPFWVDGPDGFISPQIVEKSQVDMDDPEQAAIVQTATHFNPVDLVCGMRSHRGEWYALKNFTDPETGFISHKSKDGRRLKAMELPGLWNGSMADWITVFVEVPLSTFSPVKTVNDLLKEEHRS
ncbi:DUF4301 family protein [Maridesulfovibrio salexigens]|uniref:Putative cytoplasmic protein n=1 Tax=Maridesulfovibrio salexigens (strain ATCC 14822 / DSM 2638 / NCIMB 8403 / VKM B-1763) TaxID=526222 RepID=C6BY64_MARSD|nr:DUF4301 family protein [Maridesulfovibrio salexigens]ACS80594.1 putative cytoplasmic protein [Maridesulfovibrio salexigens DSM 2638]